MQAKTNRLALRVSLIYCLVAGVWILLSDWALVSLVSDPETIGKIAVFKGWAFVVVTALLLYFMLRNRLRHWEQESVAHRQSQESLRERESHYRSLFENMLNGFAFCRMHFDGDRPQDFTYLDVIIPPLKS